MTTLEKVLETVKSLTPEEKAKVRKALDDVLLPERPKISREEYERHLLAKGIISRIPPRTGKRPDQLKDFQPIKVEGEPLSEMIIRERR
jgi:hypothetical protein